MKLFIALCALIAAVAVSGHDQKHIPIVKYQSELDSKHGSYQYGYESANGIGVAERGQVRNLGQKEHEEMVSEGYFTFTDPKGHKYTVHYTADGNGFRAVGDHLPTPPPQPANIQKVWDEVKYENNNYQSNNYEKHY